MIELNIVFLLLILLLLKLDHQNQDFIGLKIDLFSIQTVLISFLIAISYSLISVFLLYPLLSLFALTVETSRFDNLLGNLYTTLIMLLKSWIFAAFIEEVIFRGYMMRMIQIVFKQYVLVGNVFAIIFSSLTFAMIHSYQGLGGIVYTGISGLFFGVLFLYFRNLYINIMVHGFLNTFFLFKKYWGIVSLITYEY